MHRFSPLSLLAGLLLASASLAVLPLGCGPQASRTPDASRAEHTPELGFRPNILWLVAEDLSPYLPSFGDSTIETPTLSRLAAEGVRYTHFFSPSGVCSPSRAAIATGMYPASFAANHMRTGPWYVDLPGQEMEAVIEHASQYMPEGIPPYEAMPPAEVMMHAEYLRRAGYYCSNNVKEDYQFRKSLAAWDESSNTAHWRNREPGQPFFSIFNFEVTHESRIWRKAEDSLWVDEDLDVQVPPYLPDNDIGRRDMRRMYSNIKEMDAQVGEVLAQLEADGLLDSTIVFWYSDHGGPLPRQKRLMYDSGIRVPMIIRFPGKFRAGEVDDQLISFIDLKPTMLSLTGIDLPDYLHGQAFLGKQASSTPRQYIHAASDRSDAQYDMIRAVRDHRYKYLRNFQPDKSYYMAVSYREQMPVMQELLRMNEAGELNEVQAQWFRPQKDPEELFDTQTDPHELNNLADDPAHADKLEELRAECDRWMEEIKDVGEVPEVELIAQLWPGMVQPKTAAPQGRVEEDRLILRCETEGASLVYQVVAKDGGTPGQWKIYQQPIEVGEKTQVLAQAHRLGYVRSDSVYVDLRP